MSKHVIDGPKTKPSDTLTERFTQIEGDRLPRPQTLTMQKRSRSGADGARLTQYMAIDRRRTMQKPL